MKTDEEGQTMSILAVPGARLYYELRGTGPLLALVPGAKGEAGTYQHLAEELSGRYRVVTYDRRGFSHSHLAGPQDDQRLAADTDDLRSLITQLTDQPATVFGNSSGAIVALELLTHYPELVRTVVAHEPPAVNLLPDAVAWWDFFDSVYDTYRTSGIPAAMRQFATAFSDADRRALHRQAMRPDNSQYREANASYWMEHELRQYPRVDLDLDALAAHVDRLVLAGGRDSRGGLAYRTSQALAGKLGLDLLELPGGHFGCVTQPTEFAAELIEALAD
jgi:pimeloyl-ACP methyl ester carboxylesterase